MHFAKNLGLFLTLCLSFFSKDISAHSCGNCDWYELLKGNKEFIHNPCYAKERAELVDGQNPHYVILSCSDSRVPPEIVFDQGLGDLFVTRVAGNTVDAIVVDSIEFAVSTWDVTTLVVLGHTRCGAVEGALERLRRHNGRIDERIGDHLNAVLIPIEIAIVEAGIDIYAHNALELATQANIAHSVNQLIKRSPVIKKAIKNGQIIIVGAEYHLRSGRVEQLFIVNKCGFTYECGWDLHEG